MQVQSLWEKEAGGRVGKARSHIASHSIGWVRRSLPYHPLAFIFQNGLWVSP